MPKHHSPRHGSMQYWPRVRAKHPVARVRSWNPDSKESVLGFLGYKAGMTHVIGIDTRKNASTKGEELFVPVSVIECPPLRIAGLRLYKRQYSGIQPFKDIIIRIDKSLSRKIVMKKAHDISALNINDADEKELVDAKLLVYTQPRLAGLPKKTPEIMEIALPGTVADKIKYVKENHDKELSIDMFFKEGEFVDIHAITRGKGLQGPVKRFGVAFKPHKTEKGVRRVGTLGAWSGQGHVLYRVPHPGQMGYHMRTEHNKQIIKISTKPDEVNPRGGFPHYGTVRSSYVMIKGSVAGAKKRTIVLTKALRQKASQSLPTITYISQEPKN